MEPDEPDAPLGDDAAFSQPPEPHERTWLHPSEFNKLMPGRISPERRAERSARVRPLAVPLVAGMVGAALMLGGIALTGNLRKTVYRRFDIRTYAGSALSPDDPDGASAIVATAAPAVLGVRVTSPGGARSGSALVYRSDGRLLTSYRIVGDASAITVVLSDGTVRTAHFVGGDAETDIAVMTIDGSSPPVATLAKGSGLQRGQWAIAVGAANTAGSGPTVSVGFIASLAQNVNFGTRDYYDLIATTAVAWPVQSGGAMVNRNGVVIGITMVANSGEPALAIPIDVVRRVADEILEHGRATHAWLGLTATELDPGTAGEYGTSGGVLVSEVAPNGPAAKAGVEVQDVITSFSGDKVATQGSLLTLLLHHQPGDSVSLTVMRGGKPRTVHATLIDRPIGPIG